MTDGLLKRGRKVLLLLKEMFDFVGKAVFCEKPISENTEGTKACYEVAESANQPLLCSFNR